MIESFLSVVCFIDPEDTFTGVLGYKNVTLFTNNNSGPTSENRRNSDHMKKKSSYVLNLINLKTRKTKSHTIKTGPMVPITT